MQPTHSGSASFVAASVFSSAAAVAYMLGPRASKAIEMVAVHVEILRSCMAVNVASEKVFCKWKEMWSNQVRLSKDFGKKILWHTLVLPAALYLIVMMLVLVLELERGVGLGVGISIDVVLALVLV